MVQCQESRHCLDTVTRQTIRHIWSANLRSHYFRCSDPGCYFTGKGDSSIHNRIRTPGNLADDDFPVRRSHQVHGRSAFPTQPKVLDSTFRMVSSRSRVHMVIVCLNHEDLPTAKIVEWCVAGWISTRGYHCHSRKHRCGRCRPVEFGFFEAQDHAPVRAGVHSQR